MAIICEKRAMTLNFKEDKPQVYVMTQVRQQQVTFENLLDEISSSCGVGRTQVKASVEGLLDRMSLFMDYGMSVKLGDFGTFKPVINVKSQKSIEDVGASNIKRKKIIFRPGKRLKNMLGNLSIVTMDDAASSGKLPEGGGSAGGEDDGYIDPSA